MELPGRQPGRAARREPDLRRVGKLTVHVRPLVEDELPAAADLAARAFQFQYADRSDQLRWHERMRLPLRTDPAASLITERDGQLVGEPDRRRLPRRDPRVRDADGADLDALAEVSRVVRGGPHTHELEHALALGDRVLQLDDRGFSVVRPGHGPWLLAARDEQAATSLLCSSLAEDAPHLTLRWISDQDWSVQAALRLGLELRPFGAVCVRGDPGPLHPYLPSGAYC